MLRGSLVLWPSCTLRHRIVLTASGPQQACLPLRGHMGLQTHSWFVDIYIYIYMSPYIYMYVWMYVRMYDEGPPLHVVKCKQPQWELVRYACRGIDRWTL